MLLSHNDGGGIRAEQGHGHPAGPSPFQRNDATHSRPQLSICVYEHGDYLFCALCNSRRNGRPFDINTLLSVLLWTEAGAWPPGIVARYLQHPHRDIKLDPVLRSISHYRSRQEDSQFDLFIQLARFNSPASEQGCGFWLPWACAMRNPLWAAKLNKRWRPRDIHQNLKKRKDGGESLKGRPRRLGLLKDNRGLCSMI